MGEGATVIEISALRKLVGEITRQLISVSAPPVDVVKGEEISTVESTVECNMESEMFDKHW